MASLLKKYEGGLSYNEIQAHTAKSRKWYIEQLKTLKLGAPSRLLRDRETIKKSRMMPGRMFMFTYDPKTKDTLPFYDTFPLVMVVDKVQGHPGFYGLNFHYLEYRKRGILLEKLLTYKSDNRFDEKTKLRLSYDLLKSASKLREFKPCFKHYLPSQITSQLKLVPSEYWETVLFMPSERFQKESKKTVFADSRRKYL